ncbi:hypothetical protein BDN71DRAFT_1513235 [Pleurotus eryngii]|uniref:Uncharacterized protein n=1 Tax=Pleurotus eryngii TaxID=5323 RepID=A0A9P5ZKX2_PLEER|nr:hypothetical protein BDN71DRAFT_1513235 [Pleurotus eryngii]
MTNDLYTPTIRLYPMYNESFSKIPLAPMCSSYSNGTIIETVFPTQSKALLNTGCSNCPPRVPMYLHEATVQKLKNLQSLPLSFCLSPLLTPYKFISPRLRCLRRYTSLDMEPLKTLMDFKFFDDQMFGWWGAIEASSGPNSESSSDSQIRQSYRATTPHSPL